MSTPRRFGRKNRSSSKLGAEDASDPTKRIKELEKALEERDKTIAEQKDKIKELSNEIDYRKRLVDDLTEERNALRRKNSNIVGKLAELSRKQSVSSFMSSSPPQLPKRPSLPPTPASPDTPYEESPNDSAFTNGSSKFNFSSPAVRTAASKWQNGIRHSPPQSNHVLSTTKEEEEESETDYSDMEDTDSVPSVAMEAKSRGVANVDKSEFVNSGMVLESEVDSVLASVTNTARRVNLIAATSNLENHKDSPQQSNGEKKENEIKRGESLKAKSPVDKSPPKDEYETQFKPKMRTSVEILTAKFERVASSGTLPDQASTYQGTKRRASNTSITQGSPHSPSNLSGGSPSDSIFSEVASGEVKRSASIQNESRVVATGKTNRPSSAGSANALQESKRVGSSSESIASRIASMLPGNWRGSKDRTSPHFERKNDTSVNGDIAIQQNGKIQTPDTPTANEATDEGASTGVTPPRTMPKGKQESVISNMGSDIFSSGDYSTTDHDIDSSLDFTSPPVSPQSSLGASSLTKVVVSPAKNSEQYKARKAALKVQQMKKKPRFNVEWEEGEEDTLGDLLNSTEIMRSRTKTLSSTSGVSTRTAVELGRMNKRSKKEMRERQFSLKKHHSLTDLTLLGRDFAKELELISPDFESKIRDRIRHAVSEKYGGLEKATQAAIKIQHCWRQFKLRSRFQKIKQQNKSQLQIQMRKRAQSMRDPRRRPSIMRKKNKAYTREKSLANISPQILKRAAAVAGSPLSFQKSLGSPVKITEELIEREEEEMLEGVPERITSDSTCIHSPLTLSDDSTAPKFQLNDSSVVSELPAADSAKNTPDGLTNSSSFTSGELSTPRPLSVFSSASSVSSSGSYQDDLGKAGRTLPRMRPMKRFDSRERALSVGNLLTSLQSRKRSIGINHFNRKPTKGIQYLVESQVLVDDPRSVADFLTESTKHKLSKQKIGEFVGEINSDFNMAVLGCLLEQMDMSSKPIDTALRELQQLFRMPGEAQKIDKIMEIFALEYYRHNKEEGAIKSEDAAYILSFAIMMLHTALHNPSVKHKTTKREWVSMNRGCNDGQNFPEDFLLEIYDRIQVTEFICGKDHTQEVAEIEKQIIGSTTLPKLTTPQRHLVIKMNVTEISDLSRGPNFGGRHRHRRTVFVFNDLVVVCKQRRHEQYQCRQFFPLLHVLPVNFETEHYRNGIQLHSSIERKLLLQCTCDSLEERSNLHEKLEESIKELEEMENERIEELGSSLSAKPVQDVQLGGSVRHTSTKSLLYPQHSLASSSLTDLRKHPVAEERELGGNVDDEELTLGGEDSQLRPTSSVSARNNRSSGDSGFDSPQQNTPLTTPTPSPTEQNIVEGTDSLTPSPSPSPSPSLIPPSSPSMLTPGHSSTSISHSRSHDGLRMLTVYPTLPDRCPSADLIRSSPSPSPSPSHKRNNKKDKTPKEKKRSHYVNIFSIGRSRGKDIKAAAAAGVSPGSSPLHNRKRRASDSAQVTHSVNIRDTSSSPPGHKALTQTLQLSSSGGHGSASDHEGQSHNSQS